MDIFVKITNHELSRILSNLLNNSIEASSVKCEIIIKLITHNNSVQISISDNSKGIPKDKLNIVFERGASFGKKNGTGDQPAVLVPITMLSTISQGPPNPVLSSLDKADDFLNSYAV
jgi:K+-sensing histidine kinase KdpD